MIDVTSPWFAMIALEAVGIAIGAYGIWSMSRRDRRIRHLEAQIAEQQARREAAAHPAE